MPRAHLNPELLEKLVAKTGKEKQYLREQISRKASKLGVSSIAAQLLMARDAGIGIARALNKLSADVRKEVRSVDRPSQVSRLTSAPSNSRPSRTSQDAITAATIDSLLEDQQLRERCKDLLLARKHFDRVFREATTVLLNLA